MQKRSYYKPEAWLENWRKRKASLGVNRLRQLTPKYKFTTVKRLAKAKGKDFDLSYGEYADLIAQGCYYCGLNLLTESGVSLDRKNNHKGYCKSNVLPCCGSCNRIRNVHLTVDEMKVAMDAVIEYRREKSSKKA